MLLVHGRGVIHRDVKPSNCILALVNTPGETSESSYNWPDDLTIWKNGVEGINAAASNKWKLMLVDFGFARALEKNEIDGQVKKMRNSIAYEQQSTEHQQQQLQEQKKEVENGKTYQPYRTINSVIPEDASENPEDDSVGELDMAALETMVSTAVSRMRNSHFEATNSTEDAIMNDSKEQARERHSYVSVPLPDIVPPPMEAPRKSGSGGRRISSARHNVRSMSALGTKAYAAPEIRKQLRHKNEEDFEKANAAMTECVADYGMIVDAYSVGWTLRVAMTGVPPNFTISEYMHERDAMIIGESDTTDEFTEPNPSACCCFGLAEMPTIRIRDPSMLPPAATLLITRLTEKDPEERMTVREAQNNAWITADENEANNEWVMPVGDYPSRHGDPVVTLKCAEELSQLTVKYHLQ
jgi:serine/threonine protein kinase